MKSMIRGLKGLLALGALAGIGLGLRWVTTDSGSSIASTRSVDSVMAQDLTALASLAIGAVAWIAYTWLLIAVLATVLEQIPGAVGRSASAVASRITSQGSRALLRSALGVAAVTPLTIGAAHAAPGDPGTSPADWRATEKASSVRLTERPTSTAHPGQGRVAVPKKPNVAVPRKQPDKLPAGRVVVPDRPTVGAPTRYTDLQTGRTVRPAAQVVKPGDSLWALAAAELGPGAGDAAVATRWPQWHAANRKVIGPDPDLIRPGQILRTPKPAAIHADQPVPPTHQEK